MSDDDQIRRLLADARHDEPLPPDVADRLDGVIADLRAERPVRPVGDLAAARRRRRVRTMLVAAAVVVVAGIGIDQLRGWSPSGSADAGSSADSSLADGEANSDAGGGTTDEAPLTALGDGAMAVPSPSDVDTATRLESGRFARQVAALQRRRMTTDTRGSVAQDYNALKGVRCSMDVGRGRVVPVRYDDSPGVLVFRPVHGDTQVVDLYLCGRDEPTRSITLPAP